MVYRGRQRTSRLCTLAVLAGSVWLEAALVACSGDHRVELTTEIMRQYSGTPSNRPHLIRWSTETSQLRQAFFLPSGQRGWVVGNEGTVLRTEDAGANWILVEDVPTSVRLCSVVFDADGLRGWAVGDAGTILMSVNGGASWTLATDVPTRARLHSVEFST